MKLKFISMVLICSVICVISCSKIDVFEKNVSIPKLSWQYNFRPQFDFTITDTSSSYNLYLVIRHTDAYRYNNIWLNVGIQPPGDTLNYKRLDVLLGTDANGWYGSGLDDIWEYRKLITNGPYQFKKKGDYKISLAQIMREDPLNNIMSVGLRVEKIK
jgi:gliding motility-associated lipoprotein GldH